MAFHPFPLTAVGTAISAAFLICIKTCRPRLWNNDRMKTEAAALIPPAGNPPVKKTANDLAAARLAREWKTLAAMVRIYCRDQHHPDGGFCATCAQFLGYANARLERCQFSPDKPTCARCPVHCYQRERREQVRRIMRYAGPRMMWEHPVMTVRHWLDGFRRVPEV
jgi:hypothetical protein